MNTTSKKVLIKLSMMVIITIAVWYLPSDFYRLLIPKGRYHLESSIQAEIRMDNFFMPFLFDIVMILIFGCNSIMFDVRKCIQHTKINKLFNFGVGIYGFIIIGAIWGAINCIAMFNSVPNIIIGNDPIENMRIINQAKMTLANNIYMTELSKRIFGPLFFLSLIYALIAGCRERD